MVGDEGSYGVGTSSHVEVVETGSGTGDSVVNLMGIFSFHGVQLLKVPIIPYI